MSSHITIDHRTLLIDIQHSDEDLSLVDLAGLGGDALAGIAGLHDRASLVTVAIGRVGAALEGQGGVAKPFNAMLDATRGT